MSSRYEILPFAAAETDAARLRRPVPITVTCSPRLGVDHTIDVATRLAGLGHDAIAHVAARAIRDRRHLDQILSRLADTGLDEIFLVGGDASEPLGAYASAVDVLEVLSSHPLRPRRIGIAAYPEGHPQIAAGTLAEALHCKAPLADYMVTQLCFDPRALQTWIQHTRAAGITLPLYVGIPGDVDRRRLLEISMRIGVGTSIGFLRKQHGFTRLLGRPHHAAAALYEAFAPLVGAPELSVAGLHFFTFNRLQETLDWEARMDGALSHRKVAVDG